MKKLAIKKLSLISLICTALSCVTYFVDIQDWGFFPTIISCQPNILQLIAVALELSPCILMVICIFKYYNQNQSWKITSLIFQLIAITPIYFTVHEKIERFSVYPKDLIFDFVFFIFFALAAYSLKKKPINKIFITVAILIGLIVEVINIIDLIPSISRWTESGHYLYYFTTTLDFIGGTTLYIALLVFGLSANSVKSQTLDAIS